MILTGSGSVRKQYMRYSLLTVPVRLLCRCNLMLIAHLRRFFDDFAGGGCEYSIEPLTGVKVHVPKQPLILVGRTLCKGDRGVASVPRIRKGSDCVDRGRLDDDSAAHMFWFRSDVASCTSML